MNLLRSLAARLGTVRALPLLNPAASRALRVDHGGGYPVAATHDPHLAAAIDWLCDAQDATPDDGVSRGYSIAWNTYWKRRGWQPSYPETTGYIIPTLLGAASFLKRPELVDRAIRAARWECAIQMPSGAVQGGVIGEEPLSPAVFNTGQVMLGWLAAFETTADPVFRTATLRAGDYLVAALGPDGFFRDGNSQFARPDSTLYNARVAWALAEAGTAFAKPEFHTAATTILETAAARQTPDGWFPDCDLSDPERPLLHTISYTIRGLLEGGRVLERPHLVEAAQRGARRLIAAVRDDGWMPGRFARGMKGAVPWSCLTGNAQSCNNWMRLHDITGDDAWLEQIPPVLRFLESTQDRDAKGRGLRGIHGAWPVDGAYGAYEILNWATKYFADAIMRWDVKRGSSGRSLPAQHRLA